jgi:C-terminal processing protease CtpA/Prc
VAVLVGPRTASSGEVTAMAFIGRPAARLFGQPTGGYTSANATYKLPDGAGLILATTTEADRTHQVHLGPLVPDEAVPPAPVGSSTDPALQAGSAWLRKQTPASK